jgi:hypothetical protein
VGTEAEDSLVFGQIGGWDVVVLVVAFVGVFAVVFVHADKLTLQMR